MATLELLVESGLTQYYILIYPPITQQRKNGCKSSWETLFVFGPLQWLQRTKLHSSAYLSFEITFISQKVWKNQWLVSHWY